MNRTMLLIRSMIMIIAVSLAGNELKAQDRAKTLHDLNSLLIHTVMVDFFSPPVASRIYAYPNIAFYEIIRHEDASLPAVASKLNGHVKLPSHPAQKIDNFIAACLSYSYVAQSLVGSEYKIENWRNAFMDSINKTNTDSVITRNSMRYARSVADSMISWIKKDNYNQSRGMPRFTYSSAAGTWRPTPEDYSQALEPHWTTIRTFTLTSPSQFSPKEKLVYSNKKNSTFYKTMMEVYQIGVKLDTNQKAIAKYWDDNPNVSVNMGHLNYFIHKISPGGHWVMITKQACQKKKETVSRAALAYSLSAIAMYDGFIACWDEKFKTNLVRPITVINDHVDKNWQPYIQTPPFPEFTSGHAVVSNAAATVLTALFGDNFEFTDETEIPFGNEKRHFKSFNEAAKESSMSRVYGGIHYPETARISIGQGKDLGIHVLQTLYPAALK